MRKILPILIFSLSLMLLINTYALYGDIFFDVKDNGKVEISGETNYELFKGTTNSLTSKDGEIWFLNITSPVFEEYIYRVKLPKYSVINYVKANNQLRIEQKSGSIQIIGTGKDKPIEIKVQYLIDKTQEKLSYLLIVGAFIIVAGMGFLALKIRRKTNLVKKQFRRELYTDRQLKILDYLQKNGTTGQSNLEKNLKIPKASLSRNIKTLVQKGVIFSETKGMSNVIGLK